MTKSKAPRPPGRSHDDVMQAIMDCARRDVDENTIAAIVKEACGCDDWLASKIPPAKRAAVIAALEQLEAPGQPDYSARGLCGRRELPRPIRH